MKFETKVAQHFRLAPHVMSGNGLFSIILLFFFLGKERELLEWVGRSERHKAVEMGGPARPECGRAEPVGKNAHLQRDPGLTDRGLLDGWMLFMDLFVHYHNEKWDG